MRLFAGDTLLAMFNNRQLAFRGSTLFSATFPDAVRTLAAGFMRDPVTVEVALRNMPIELIGQVVHPVDVDRKRELLAHLVKANRWPQVLVFTRTKHGANRLAEQRERDGIEASAIHGNKSQPQRMRALKRFKDCELQVLVATDIAARGRFSATSSSTIAASRRKSIEKTARPSAPDAEAILKAA